MHFAQIHTEITPARVKKVFKETLMMDVLMLTNVVRTLVDVELDVSISWVAIRVNASQIVKEIHTIVLAVVRQTL